MANLIMPSGKEGFATAAINWVSDDIRVVLLSAGYTFSASDDFLNDIPGGAVRVAVSGALAGKTAAGGVLDADDFTLPSVSGAQITQGFYYKHTGTESTSRLIIYFDQGVILPYTPNGRDILFENADGANKIAAL